MQLQRTFLLSGSTNSSSVVPPDRCHAKWVLSIKSRILAAFSRQKIEIPFQSKSTFILYDKERVTEAIVLARDFRKNGKVTELVKRNENISVDTYINKAKKNLCSSMMYLKNTNEIEMINLATGATKTVTSKIK